MQLKSTRGVQQEEVWTAADALIGEGLRPTIERVRLKIGRGSPNTVSPMLDAWFANLGSRLGVTADKQTQNGELPVSVRQAAIKLWQSALLSAQGVAEQALFVAQQTLATQRTALEQQEADILSREQVFAERQLAMEEILQVTRGQIIDLTTRLEQSQIATKRREGDLDALQLKLADYEKQRMAEQRRSEDEIKRHAEERLKLEERATNHEHRMMLELDRERQESKRAKTVGNQFQTELQAQTQKRQAIEQELRSERQALQLANQRTNEMRGLLDEQRTANGTAIAQLSQLLLQTRESNPIILKSRKRVSGKVIKPSRSP